MIVTYIYFPLFVRYIVLRCDSNHYAILGVSKTAEEVEIKKAYKKLALKLHLDKNHAPKSDEAFKGICTATTMCKFKFRNVCENVSY